MASQAALKNNQSETGHGGRREGAGRPRGAPNKSNATLRDIARGYTQEAIDALVSILSSEDEPAAARVSAANALLDRGYGKAATVINGDDEGGPVVTVIKLIGVAPE